MSIATKHGDTGQTALIGGERVSKAHLRVEAYGTIDELGAQMGFARAICADREVHDLTKEVEKVAIDARRMHTYSARWTSTDVSFFVDDHLIKVVLQSPDYPMQFMLDIYEFADGPDLPSPPDRYPKIFEVAWFRGYRPVAGPDARDAAFTDGRKD